MYPSWRKAGAQPKQRYLEFSAKERSQGFTHTHFILTMYTCMMKTILLIEDELELVQILSEYLEQAGYKTQNAQDGPSGLSLFKQSHPDLVLLDLNLPGMDGLEVARQMRQVRDVPIIMVTARVEETDRLIGLALGADDYISKPFSPREVVARVHAVLRRVSTHPEAVQMIRALDVEVDLIKHQARVAGEVVDLTPTEFVILAVLAAQPGRVFTRLQLLEHVQGDAYEGYERTIDAHVKNLRSKMETDPKNPRYIETVFGVGYRFSDA